VSGGRGVVYICLETYSSKQAMFATLDGLAGKQFPTLIEEKTEDET
jgi:hypothetical protein